MSRSGVSHEDTGPGGAGEILRKTRRQNLREGPSTPEVPRGGLGGEGCLCKGPSTPNPVRPLRLVPLNRFTRVGRGQRVGLGRSARVVVEEGHDPGVPLSRFDDGSTEVFPRSLVKLPLGPRRGTYGCMGGGKGCSSWTGPVRGRTGGRGAVYPEGRLRRTSCQSTHSRPGGRTRGGVRRGNHSAVVCLPPISLLPSPEPPGLGTFGLLSFTRRDTTRPRRPFTTRGTPELTGQPPVEGTAHQDTSCADSLLTSVLTYLLTYLRNRTEVWCIHSKSYNRVDFSLSRLMFCFFLSVFLCFDSTRADRSIVGWLP